MLLYGVTICLKAEKPQADCRKVFQERAYLGRRVVEEGGRNSPYLYTGLEWTDQLIGLSAAGEVSWRMCSSGMDFVSCMQQNRLMGRFEIAEGCLQCIVKAVSVVLDAVTANSLV